MTTLSAYRLERDQARTIVALLPELNEAPWSDIDRIGTEIVQRLHEVASPALLVDLCSLQYMGSSQVALVVRLFKTVKERGGKMVVANRDPMVLEVMTLAGLNKLWTITPSREDALRLLGGSGETNGNAGHWQGWLGTVCVAASLVGLIATISRATWMAPNMAIALEFTAAGVAFLFGLWGVLKGSGGPRVLGAGVVVGSVALLLSSAFVAGSMQSNYPQVARPNSTLTPLTTTVVSLPPTPEPDPSPALPSPGADTAADAASPANP